MKHKIKKLFLLTFIVALLLNSGCLSFQSGKNKQIITTTPPTEEKIVPSPIPEEREMPIKEFPPIKVSEVDHLSLATTPILLYQDDKIVSQGTGFYYARKHDENLSVLYLITNYHVLTGSSPTETKEPIGNNIVFQFHTSKDNTGEVRNVKFPLFTKSGKSTWITSSSYPTADLAVIPILPSFYQGAIVNAISAEWTKSSLKVRPSSKVTLIGYPYGFYDEKNALPIWKTGSIASEPEANFGGIPNFLVDVSAFPGMSGSPVFAISYGMYETEEGATTVGGARKFLGIYSSMQMLEENKYLEEIPQEKRPGIKTTKSLELGHVWKADLILETVESIDVKKYQNEILNDLK